MQENAFQSDLVKPFLFCDNTGFSVLNPYLNHSYVIMFTNYNKYAIILIT